MSFFAGKTIGYHDGHFVYAAGRAVDARSTEGA